MAVITVVAGAAFDTELYGLGGSSGLPTLYSAILNPGTGAFTVEAFSTFFQVTTRLVPADGVPPPPPPPAPDISGSITTDVTLLDAGGLAAAGMEGVEIGYLLQSVSAGLPPTIVWRWDLVVSPGDWLLGDDTATMADEDDRFVDPGGALTLWGRGGDDEVEALSGGDPLDGADVIHGEAGDDRLLSESDGSTLYGGLGDDDLRGSGAGLSLLGGAGGDTLVAGGDGQRLFGGLGDDALFADGGGAVATLFGGAGDDSVTLDGDTVIERAGSGDDSYAVTPGGIGLLRYDGDEGVTLDASLFGQAQDTGAFGTDTISGFGAFLLSQGGDTYLGADGPVDEAVAGRGGDDSLSGGGGTDVLLGGAGDDTIAGGEGDDRLDGGAGRDRASFAASTGPVIAGLAAKVAFGLDSGQDVLLGFEDLEGGDGDDLLGGDGRANSVLGLGGDDRIAGLAGDDALLGGGGGDTLAGGAGSDGLAGGAGADTFLFDGAIRPGDEDWVADFAPGEDRIAFAADVFGMLGAPGALDPGRFGLGTAAATNAQRLLYDAATGELRLDLDGARAGASAGIVARLDAGLALTAADFVLL